MNRGDIVKIIKKVPLFNGMSWANAFQENLIKSESLYAIYIREAATAPILAYKGSTYYSPAESFQLEENAFCLVTLVRRGRVIITSYDGLKELTSEGELLNLAANAQTTDLSFDSHEQANRYIRENFQVLTEW